MNDAALEADCLTGAVADLAEVTDALAVSVDDVRTVEPPGPPPTFDDRR
jgi:hypothetical protein